MMEMDAVSALLRQPLWAYYISVMLVMAPVARIFLRAGFRAYWALLLLVPYVGYIACAGALALRPWPVLPKKGAKA